MNRTFLGCMVLLLVATSAAKTARGQAENAKNFEKKTSKNEIVFSAQLPEKSTAGSAVNLKIILQNESKADLSMTFRTKYSLYDLNLLDSKGKTVPLTQYGKIQYGVVRSEGSIAIVTVASGKHRNDALNLARMFDLSKEGEYTLSIRLQIEQRDKEIPLEIEKMSFKMVEEPR